jgi:hypothetical protein
LPGWWESGDGYAFEATAGGGRGAAGRFEGVVSVAELATCYRCGRELPGAEFSRDRSKASGRSSICRPCDALKGRRYYRENREQVLARHKAPPREAVCAGCGEPFTKHGRQRYCKPECRPAKVTGATVTVVCAWCGREFEARARDRARGGGRFCCKSHALQARNSPAVAA